MRKKIRVAAAFMAAAMAVSALSACGGSKKPAESQSIEFTEAATEATQATQAAQGEKESSSASNEEYGGGYQPMKDKASCARPA